jgi:spore maturation protein CgeB
MRCLVFEVGLDGRQSSDRRMTRIFMAVRHSIDAKQYYGGLWSSNFYPALRELGCEIVESQIDLLSTSRFMAIASGFTREELEVRANTTEKILDEVREAKRQGPVDLFLSYFYNAHFDPAGFDDLRGLGIPSVNFYCNSIYQFAQVAAIAAKAEFSWHPEKDARASYLTIGARPLWVQMGADPHLCRPVRGIERQPKVCFVGQRYADRERWLAALVQANVLTDIYGSGWGIEVEDKAMSVCEERFYLGRRQSTPGTLRSYLQLVSDEARQHGVVNALKRLNARAAYKRERRGFDRTLHSRVRGRAGDLARVFSAYEVCTNFSNVWADGHPGSPLIPHVRLRDFEAPMCRTCYLTGNTDEIRQFYAVGREIDTYHDESELIDKVRFYLTNRNAAEALREAGYRRALRDHTWKRRFEELFVKIKLNVTRP